MGTVPGGARAGAPRLSAPPRVLTASAVNAARPLLLALALLASPAPASAATAATPLAAKVKQCTSATNPESRVGVFTGSMPRRDDAKTLAMRFTLLQRAKGDSTFRALDVPEFARWERSAPNVAGFVFDRRVVGLQPGAAYRVEVRFRWYRNGQVVRRAQRTSPTCLQDDLRPDLHPDALLVSRPAGAPASYTLILENAGRSAVLQPFGVTLTIDGVPVTVPDQVTALAAGATTRIVAQGPACAPGQALRLTVDPLAGVDEAREDDNVLTRPCPATDDA